MRVVTWLCSLWCALAGPAVAATATVKVTLDPARARVEPVPRDFAGVSIEMQTVRAGFSTPRGHWLSAGNAPFVALVKRLGVRSVRVGGNTTERNAPDGSRPLKPYPSDADATHVNDFVNANHKEMKTCLKLYASRAKYCPGVMLRNSDSAIS